MELKNITRNIVVVTFSTQYKLASAFARLQEFYESEYDNIRGKKFSLDELMDTYAEDNGGEFSYFTDFSGFNVPGAAILEFISVHEPDIRDAEALLLSRVLELVDKNEPFYVIAVSEDDQLKNGTLKHELAHALFYTDRVYREESKDLSKQLSIKSRRSLYEFLIECNYSSTVYWDEINAYMSTNTFSDFKEYFGWVGGFRLYRACGPFRDLFEEAANRAGIAIV